MYGDAKVDVSTVRQWVRHCKVAEGQTRLADETWSGRPVTAVTPGNIQRVDDIIHGDRQVKTDELCRILSFSKGSVITIIHQLGYRKFCARWVPRMLNNHNKETRKTIASKHFQRFQLEGEEFMEKNCDWRRNMVSFF